MKSSRFQFKTASPHRPDPTSLTPDKNFANVILHCASGGRAVSDKLLKQIDSYMKKIEEYREHAEECRTLARRSKTQADRDMLLNMADTWDKLADGRAKSIQTQQRLASIKDQ